MKKTLFSVLLIWIVQTGWSQTNFDWTLALSSNIPVSFSQPIEMKTGDNFSLLLTSETPSYCYIIVQDSEQKVQVVNNSRLDAKEEVRLGPINILPPSGREVFFVVMSHTEQRDLSSKISIFERNATLRNGREVINEVLALRRAVSVLNENPEKPIFMGGAFRGGSDEGFNGSEFSGSNCYVKTITISH